MAILTGLLLGLSTLTFIGPVFFYLLKSSMESGFKAGAYVAFGVITGDIIYVLAVLHGAGSYFEDPVFQKWLSLVGGLLLLGMGIKYFFFPTLSTDVEERIRLKSNGIYFLNGFLINFVNPFVIAVWVGFATLNESMYDHNSTVISLIATLFVIFTTDILKVLFANKISKLVKPEVLKRIYRLFGLVMLVFGVRLLLILLP